MGSPGCFQIICGVQYFESMNIIRKVLVSRSVLKDNISTNILMAHSLPVDCRDYLSWNQAKNSTHSINLSA